MKNSDEEFDDVDEDSTTKTRRKTRTRRKKEEEDPKRRTHTFIKSGILAAPSGVTFEADGWMASGRTSWRVFFDGMRPQAAIIHVECFPRIALPAPLFRRLINRVSHRTTAV